MRRVPTAAIVLLAVMTPGLRPASAVDQPISGKKILLQRSDNGKEKLVFLSKDPTFLFPAIGSADDPGTGTPGGMTIELLSSTGEAALFTIPAGTGKPGWTAKTGLHPSHAWKQPSVPAVTPFKVALLKQGKLVKLVGTLAGLPLASATTRFAIRVTTGSSRSCTVFSPAELRKNEPGRLLGVDAPAPAIADCSDASLLGDPASCASADFPSCGAACPAGETCVGDGLTGSCKCVAPGMPCGDTNPTCNGACPSGEECASFGLDAPYNACGCAPVGSTPCGTPNAPTCGGACPSGTTCGAVFIPLELGGGYDCDCRASPCSNGTAWGGSVMEGQPFGCYPLFCGGTYPTCGGPCLDGGTCDAFRVDSFVGCICAVSAPCGSGGFDCGPGDVCLMEPPAPTCGMP